MKHTSIKNPELRFKARFVLTSLTTGPKSLHPHYLLLFKTTLMTSTLTATIVHENPRLTGTPEGALWRGEGVDADVEGAVKLSELRLEMLAR